MNELLVPLAIIAALAIANGLFVAAEFAIVGAPRANVDHQAAQGGRLAARVARILADPRRLDRYIATTQVGISVASLGLGMYGEHVLAEHIEVWLAPLDTLGWVASHALASGIAVGFLTYIHIVIGEMVPKGLALQSALRTSLYVSPIIEALETRAPAAGVGAQRRGQRAAGARLASSAPRTRPSAITPAKSCSSSSRRATRAGCCAASRGASCASCSSSAT